MIPTPKHFNHNLPAGVGIETTGPFVGLHDVHRLCIIPLDNFFDPIKGIIPFVVKFKPINEDAPYLSVKDYIDAKATGIHPAMAADVIKLWSSRLPKQQNKKLVPICHDWTTASAFLKELIGPDVFDNIFFEVPRDLLAAQAYINDSCNFNHEEIPFPKPGLQSMANRSCVIIEEPHDALNNCKATVQIYKVILKRMYKNLIL